MFKLYPTAEPITPPTTCDRLDILSLRNTPSYTCCPRNTMATRMNVSGISPFALI
ncbi:hypothetical protein [Butyrivibrio sp. WCE2006]|uniref:hypothetical protein n=1 Tax=Butyrivibrio sp. WCE2006 TaxID=1410611 RepID=UPI0012DF9E37